MFQKILVPVDGSKLAECSFEYAKSLAVGCGVKEVVLLRVIEPIQHEAMYAQAGDDFLGKAIAARQAEAKSYMEETEKRLKSEGFPVKIALVNGRAAETILDYAQKNNVEMIVMSTHGRSGISRWAYGSVAEKVARHSRIPVLMIAAPGCRP